jgi:hypothetical protein
MSTKPKSSPLKVIILGGALATLGYLLWTNYGTYYYQDIKSKTVTKPKSSKVVARNLFKKSHSYKTKVKSKEKDIIEKEEDSNEFTFKPISNEQRLELIKEAKNSLEARLDPFGQEGALPPSIADKLQGEEEKKPIEVSIERKQIELVGVISSRDKDLALVNIYTVGFPVTENDGEDVIEEELKKNLAMAVPNRVEVFVLDPLEEWSVKSIARSRSRSDDPSIELAKGNKKFKLKVGQKVLLPAEKTFAELVDESKLRLEEEIMNMLNV